MPQRTCVACRSKKDPAEFLRLAMSGVIETGPSCGRSAYVCPTDRCVEQAFQKDRLARAFKQKVSEATLSLLRNQIACLQQRKTQ